MPQEECTFAHYKIRCKNVKAKKRRVFPPLSYRPAREEKLGLGLLSSSLPIWLREGLASATTKQPFSRNFLSQPKFRTLERERERMADRFFASPPIMRCHYCRHPHPPPTSHFPTASHRHTTEIARKEVWDFTTRDAFSRCNFGHL